MLSYVFEYFYMGNFCVSILKNLVTIYCLQRRHKPLSAIITGWKGLYTLNSGDQVLMFQLSHVYLMTHALSIVAMGYDSKIKRILIVSSMRKSIAFKVFNGIIHFFCETKCIHCDLRVPEASISVIRAGEWYSFKEITAFVHSYYCFGSLQENSSESKGPLGFHLLLRFLPWLTCEHPPMTCNL